MQQKKNQKKGRLTKQDNEKIVSLIKAKINPIHKKSHMIVPVEMSNSAPNFYPKKKKQYQIIDQKQLKPFQILNRQAPIQIVRRTKQFIQEKRKNINRIDLPNGPVDLKIYVKLFDGSDSKQNAIVTEFLKMKRQSMHLMSFYDKPLKPNIDQSAQYQQKTQEQCSLLNARIRRRLNHRKIIGLYRYN